MSDRDRDTDGTVQHVGDDDAIDAVGATVLAFCLVLMLVCFAVL